MRKRLIPIIVAFLLFEPATAHAITANWRAPEPKDAWVLGGLATTAALAEFALPQHPFGVWSAETALDRWARSTLRAEEERTRKRISNYSDLAIGTSVLLPYIVDMGIFAMSNREYDMVERIALINLEALLANMTLTSLTKGLVGRERPEVPDCIREHGSGHCLNREANRSFVSGHSSFAFMSAGLMCLHHSQLGLAGSPGADAAICGGALALALVTGTLRIAADKHYLTDVLAGAVVGLGTGYLLPSLLFSTQAVVSPLRMEGAGSVVVPLVQLPL